MTKEQLVEDIESMKQAAKTMLYTNDITQDAYKALVLAYDAWIERIKNCMAAGLKD